MIEIVDDEVYAEYRVAVETHLREYYAARLGLPPASIDDRIASRVARVRGDALAKIVDEYVGLRRRRLLDVGCGWGELVLACLAHGADAHGVEPDPREVEISRLLLKSYGYAPSVVQGFGEALPFRDQQFDIVTCQQVLEHVSDIDRVVEELVRVTRLDGAIVVSVPNYLFPYEGHYKMKWFPLTPKRLGAIILRAKGRDPAFFLNSINYTTYPSMMKIWRRHNLDVTNVTRQLLEAGRHDSRIYERPFVRALALHLNLFPNVTWVLRRRA